MSAAPSSGIVDLARGFARSSGRRGVWAFVVMIAGALTEGIGLVLIVPIVALLIRPNAGQVAGQNVGRFRHAAAVVARSVGITTPAGQLALILALFVAAMAMRAVILGLRDRLVFELQLRFVDAERTMLFQALGQSRWQDIAGLRHARVTQALGADIPRISTALTLLLGTTTALVMLAGQWLVLLVIAPVLAALALAAILIAALASATTLRRATTMGERVRHGTLSMVDLSAQLMGGLKLALAQNMQRVFTTEFMAGLRDLGGRQRVFSRRAARIRAATTVGAAVVLAGVVLVGTGLRISAPTLIGALAIFARMFGPATTTLQATQQLAGVLPSYVAVRDLIRDLTHDRPSAGIIETVGGTITLDRVSYAHVGGAGGVRGVDVAIAQGERVGVAGASGAGKTTFVDLLCGVLVPDSGIVRIDDVPLDQVAPGWRDRIAYVAQDPYLFHDSIRRNLAWGIAAVGEAAIWTALDHVEAGQLVRRMPAGLDTMVGERGARLSGGERQRLALARALLRRPALLILDEATNAIDLPTEATLLSRLAVLLPDATIVVVGHRPETLALCDRILTFAEGRLVADVAVSVIRSR